MKPILLFQAGDLIAKLGVAAGLLVIGFEMHEANGPAPAPVATAAPAAYLMTTAAEAVEQSKKVATLSTIDADLRQINYSITGVSVAISDMNVAMGFPHR